MSRARFRTQSEAYDAAFVAIGHAKGTVGVTLSICLEANSQEEIGISADDLCLMLQGLDEKLRLSHEALKAMSELQERGQSSRLG